MTTAPKICYTVQESIYSCTSPEWQCIVDDSDARCLKVINKNIIILPDLQGKKIRSAKIDIGIKTALPPHYAVVLLGLDTESTTVYSNKGHNKHGSEDGPPIFGIANGIIDSGFRGNICAVIYYNANTQIIERGALIIRLALIKLATEIPRSRLLFNLHEAGAECEYGFKFVTSIRTAAELHSAGRDSYLPPNGEKKWEGTGCDRLLCIRDESVCASSRYKTLDSRIAFVVRLCDTAVIGITCETTSDDSLGPIDFYTGGDMATILPFTSTFLEKREEDAGYDILCPMDITLDPYTVTSIAVRQRFSCPSGAVIPCVYGRSSLNLTGILVIPSRWMGQEWLSINICNMMETSVHLNRGDRIAQLLLICRDSNVWLPFGVNCSDPFPKSRDCRLECENARSPMPRWRMTRDFTTEAPASDRNVGGFGSTGV